MEDWILLRAAVEALHYACHATEGLSSPPSSIITPLHRFIMLHFSARLKRSDSTQAQKARFSKMLGQQRLCKCLMPASEHSVSSLAAIRGLPNTFCETLPSGYKATCCALKLSYLWGFWGGFFSPFSIIRHQGPAV